MHRENTYSPVFTMVMCCIGFQSSFTCCSKIISYLAVVSFKKERERDFIHIIDEYSKGLSHNYFVHMLCFVCCFCILVFLFFSSEESWAVQVMPASAALSSASKVCLHHSSGLMPFVLMYWLLHAFLLLPAFHEMPDRTPNAWSTAHTVPLKCAA